MIGALRQTAKRLPGVPALLDTKLYKRVRHRIALMTGPRENSVFTGFCRLPTQFHALTGPVIDFLGEDARKRPLEIVLFGSSNGAEPYTIASLILTARPDLAFRISAFDIDPEIIAKARGACYSADEDVYNNRAISDDFVERTFDRTAEGLEVKSEIARHVTFEVADALDPQLHKRVGHADILVAQNFLFHLEPGASRTALHNLCTLLRPRSALLADGTDLNIRQAVTRSLGLVPLDYKLEEIHNEARWARAEGWPDAYWGLEPFMTTSRDWKRRYATIFLKGATTGP